MIIKNCLQCNKEYIAKKNKQIFCTRLCVDKYKTGIKQSEVTCILKSIAHTGKKREPFTQEHKDKIRKAKIGKKLPTFTQEHKDKIGEKNKGKIRSEYTKELLSQYFTGRPNYKARGSGSGKWKGGITPIHKSIRHSLEYKLWREAIFKRDNWICQECGMRSSKEKYIILNADHHPITFSSILNKLIVEQGLENLLEKALKYEMFWMVDNGRTLCEDCHRKTPTFAKNYKYLKN